MVLKITRRGFIATGAATIAFSHPDRGWTQTWPSKPIKIVYAYPAGGFGDSCTRIYGEYLSQKLRQPDIVENRAGGRGTIGPTTVKQAPPHGFNARGATTRALAASPVPFNN